MTTTSIQSAPAHYGDPKHAVRLVFHDNPATANWFLISGDAVIAATGKPSDEGGVPTYEQACRWADEQLTAALNLRPAASNRWERLPEQHPGQACFYPTAVLKVTYRVHLYVNHPEMQGFSIECAGLDELNAFIDSVRKGEGPIEPTHRYDNPKSPTGSTFMIFPKHLVGTKVMPIAAEF